MRFRLSVWRPAHLLGAWCGYWLALALVALGPALPAIWRVTRPDAHGSITASAGDGAARITVLSDGATVWTGSIGLLALTLWITLPPLVLWGLWLRAQRRGPSAAARERETAGTVA